MTFSNDFNEYDETAPTYQIGLGARFGETAQFDVGYRYRAVSVDIDDLTAAELDIDTHMLQLRWTGRF